jgi:hypothetical protein
MESPHDEQRFSAPRPVKLCSDQNLFCFYLELHKNKMNCELMLTYHTPTYMFNVYKNQLSRQTGSMNLTGSKTLPTIWYTYMKFVTKYQISAINSCWEKCAEKYLGRTEGRTKVKQYTPPPLRWSGGIINSRIWLGPVNLNFHVEACRWAEFCSILLSQSEI